MAWIEFGFSSPVNLPPVSFERLHFSISFLLYHHLHSNNCIIFAIPVFVVAASPQINYDIVLPFSSEFFKRLVMYFYLSGNVRLCAIESEGLNENVGVGMHLEEVKGFRVLCLHEEGEKRFQVLCLTELVEEIL
ncbi:hypothetical protein M5K25_001940 [Dendrobium thyrsiflorum]|uniref:Uncharacterized protein n=1 Tax=Dendrobium thyrsiflorum TaxID=117978 RepID=A0ABD0VRQ8_DENTH